MRIQPLRLLDTLYPRWVALVRAGEVDFAIGPVPADRLDTDLASRALFSSRSVIVVRRGHPLARARSLAALADADLVLTGPAGGPGDPATRRRSASRRWGSRRPACGLPASRSRRCSRWSAPATGCA
jgi:DNA-binding transcriptional LysR family regulator